VEQSNPIRRDNCLSGPDLLRAPSFPGLRAEPHDSITYSSVIRHPWLQSAVPLVPKVTARPGNSWGQTSKNQQTGGRCTKLKNLERNAFA